MACCGRFGDNRETQLYFYELLFLKIKLDNREKGQGMDIDVENKTTLKN